MLEFMLSVSCNSATIVSSSTGYIDCASMVLLFMNCMHNSGLCRLSRWSSDDGAMMIPATVESSVGVSKISIHISLRCSNERSDDVSAVSSLVPL